MKQGFNISYTKLDISYIKQCFSKFYTSLKVNKV